MKSILRFVLLGLYSCGGSLAFYDIFSHLSVYWNRG